MRSRVAIVLAVAFCVTAVLPLPASAEWEPDGQWMYPEGERAEPQDLIVVGDGAGGYFAVWLDSREFWLTPFVQHFSGDGSTRWFPDGDDVIPIFAGHETDLDAAPGVSGDLLVAFVDHNTVMVQRMVSYHSYPFGTSGRSVISTAAYPSFPKIASDGDDGAIVIWLAALDGVNEDIYAQRLDEYGWRAWGDTGVAICEHDSIMDGHQIIPDGTGGAIIVWSDSRGSDRDIYAQRIDHDGVIQWTAGGVLVSGAAGDQSAPVIYPYGGGGAIVAWEDGRNGHTDIYAMRLGDDGSRLWTPDGIPACWNEPGEQTEPRIVVNSENETFVVWLDTRNGDSDVYANKLSTTGSLYYTLTGMAISTDCVDAAHARVAVDGDEGAIFTWRDSRGTDQDVYGQRINNSGFIQWTSGGIALCDETNDQHTPWVVADGDGGAFLAWMDHRDGNPNIYSQRVDEAGARLWPSGGLSVCTYGGGNTSQDIVSDGEGGAIVAWQNNRNGDSDLMISQVSPTGRLWYDRRYMRLGASRNDEGMTSMVPDGSGGTFVAWSNEVDVHIQRLDSELVPLWSDTGVVVCTEPGSQAAPEIVPDGAGGVIVAWSDSRGSDWDIYAQRFDENGVPLYAAGGVPVCTASGDQYLTGAEADGYGGAVFAWTDTRTEYNDLYAQRVNASGTTLWTGDGVGVCTESGTVTRICLVSDGSGGGIFAWEDHRATGKIYAQRVDSGGSVIWDAGGKLVSEHDGPAIMPALADDGSGGAYIAWAGAPGTDYDIYARHFDSLGANIWGSSPSRICDVSGHQTYVDVLNDGTGAIFVWEDDRSGGSDIYAQKIQSNGVIYWEVDGIPVCSHSDNQTVPSIATDEAGGAVVAWRDDRNEMVEIFTQRITDAGLGPICNVYAYSDTASLTRVGEETSLSFTIYNEGQGILIGSVSLDSEHFYISRGEGQYALEAGEDILCTVRYAPQSAGDHQVTVSTGTYLCGELVMYGSAYECPPDSVVYVDASATGAGTGTSWTDALTDLQDALFIAEACPGADQVWVAAGTYLPTSGADRTASFELVSGIAVYGGFAGTETALDQRDMSANPTVLSGEIGSGAPTDNSYHVVWAFAVDNTAVLDGFTVTGGYADDASTGAGGGIYVETASPRIANVRFDGNYAMGGGGGAFIKPGAAEFFNCVFTGNTADTGGGIIGVEFTGTIVNCTFSGNTATGAGGGLYFSHLCNAGVVNTVVWGNTAPSYPEIFNTYETGTVTYSHSCLNGCGILGGKWNAEYGVDGGDNIEQDPLYVDQAAGDLRLKSGTPCEDAGDDTVPGLPPVDITGGPRILDVAVDMGAYEGAVARATVTIASEPQTVAVGIDLLVRYTPSSFETDIGAEHQIAALLSSFIRNDTTYYFMGWSDGGDTTHTITVTDSLETYTAYYSPLREYAVVDSITDVPDDQGGYARVYFSRSMYDHAWETVNPIERYNVHRRVESPELAAAVITGGKTIDDDLTVELSSGEKMLLRPSDLGDDARYVESGSRYFIVSAAGTPAAPPGVWEVVGDVSAQQTPQYICLVPTLGDSSATIPWSVYYISAHTTTPALFYDSPPDSGYSVDNIAPGVPLGLQVAYNTGDGNGITWDPSPEPDFQYYRIYRGNDESFVPGPYYLVHSTSETSWSDPDYDGWDVHYKVTALDHAGNESGPASPGVTTGDDDPGTPKAFGLFQNVPNPFNPATTIRFDLPRPTNVKLCIFNVKGELVSTLIDGRMPAGQKSVAWNGSSDSGRRAASGVYFYRIVAGDFVQTRKMVLLR